MVRWLRRRMAEAFERKWRYDASYLKEIVGDRIRAIYVVRNPDKLGHLGGSNPSLQARYSEQASQERPRP